jgi:hypothetical protein
MASESAAVLLGLVSLGSACGSVVVLLVLVFLGRPMSRRRCGWFFCPWDGQSVGGGVVGACFVGTSSESAAVLLVLVSLCSACGSVVVLLVLVFLGRPESGRRCGWCLFSWGGQ